MAAQNNNPAPCLVDEVASRAGGAAAAVPQVPLQGLPRSATVTLAFPNGRFAPDDVKRLDAHASALLGAHFCSRLYRDFWNAASSAYHRLRGAQRRQAKFSTIMQDKAYLPFDLQLPRLCFSATLHDTDDGKKLMAMARNIALESAKTLAVQVHSRGYDLEVKTFTQDAQFHRLWAVALLKTDGTLAPFTSLAEANNLDQPDFTLPVAPIFGNDPEREALVKSHLLPGLRSTALSLRQQFEDFVNERDRAFREAQEQARREKEARDRHDTEALRDKGGSVAAIASNAAKAAAEPELAALKAENAAHKEAITQLQAQVALLLQQQQQSGSIAASTPASPRTHQPMRPPSPAARPNQGRQVTFAPQVTTPTATPVLRSPAAAGAAQARPSPTPSLKPDAKKAAARKPRQPVTPSASSSKPAAPRTQPQVVPAAKPAAPATPQLPVVPSSAPPAHLTIVKNSKANNKKASGNGFAPLAHAHRATESELEPDEGDLLQDLLDEDPPQEAPPPLQPNAQRAARGGKTSRTRSQTSTGGSAGGASHH